MKNLKSILKSKDITSPTKVYIVKAMFLSVVRYRCESWAIKKTEHWRIDAFELWCWRRLLRGPWTARRSNQSGIKPASFFSCFGKPILNHLCHVEGGWSHFFPNDVWFTLGHLVLKIVFKRGIVHWNSQSEIRQKCWGVTGSCWELSFQFMKILFCNMKDWSW